MAIRLSGMASGLDTDSIVQALVSSYSYKKSKYEKAQTKLGWTQDAWKSLNTKVYSLPFILYTINEQIYKSWCLWSC